MQKIRKEYLLAPGPTPVPPEVAAAGALPLYHHRTPKFEALVQEVTRTLQYLFCTQNDVITLTASGTGAMEAAVANLVSPGEKAICASGGKFGERWVDICKAYGVEVIALQVPYGAAVQPASVAEALHKHPDTKAVFTQLSETSTGCVYDIHAIGEIVAKSNALFVVDGISGLLAEKCPVDEWKIDVMVSGSQKGFMIPPGLAFISVSPKAWSVVESCKQPRYYFDLRAYRKDLKKGVHPYTPGVGLFVQLGEACRMLRNETIEGIWARHEWMGNACRTAVRALGLALFAERPGNVLTAVQVPGTLDGEKLFSRMRDTYGVTIAGGQGNEMKGKILRIAHLGYMDRFDVLTAIGALEMALASVGHPVTFGAGTGAAAQLLQAEPHV